jgi:hypothetical protein
LIEVLTTPEPRLRQGDIIEKIEYIQSVEEVDGTIVVNKILFPLVMVLTQDCDLTWDYESRKDTSGNDDKQLISVIVAPLYNYEHLIRGEHLSDIGRTMAKFSPDMKKTDNKTLRHNDNPRYHYLEFARTVQIVNSVIDFKHYFSVNAEYLKARKAEGFVCSVSELYREQVSLRFANFLSRIGLPDPLT